MNPRENRERLRNAVNQLHDGISEVISSISPADDPSYLFPFLAYAYHHEALREPSGLDHQWPFHRPVVEMAPIFPESTNGETDFAEEIFNAVVAVCMETHIKVAKELSGFDLSDTEFLQCFVDLLLRSQKSSGRAVLPQEFLDFSSMLTGLKSPWVFIDGAALVRPGISMEYTPTEAQWVFNDKAGAFWQKCLYQLNGLAGRVYWTEVGLNEPPERTDAYVSILQQDEPLPRFTLSGESGMETFLKKQSESSVGIIIQPSSREPEKTLPLAEDGWLKSVTSFPLRIFSHRQRPETLLMVVGPPDKGQKVRFVDAKPFFGHNDFSPTLQFDPESAVRAILEGHEEFTVDVSRDHMSWSDYHLRPVRYLLERYLVPPPGSQPIALKDLVSGFTKAIKLPPEGGHVCTGSDLRRLRNRGFSYMELPLRKPESSKDGSKSIGGPGRYKLIDQDCLLLSGISAQKSVSAAIFRYNGIPIYAYQSVLPILVEKSSDLYWLLDATSQEYFLQQVSMLSGSLGIVRLHQSILNEIVVFQPEESEGYTFRRRADADKESGLLLEQRIAEIRKEFENELQSKRHNLNQPFGALKSRLKFIRAYVEKKGDAYSSDIIRKRDNCSFLSYIDAGIDECSALGKQIKGLTENLELGGPEPQILKELMGVIKAQHGECMKFTLEVEPLPQELEDAVVYIAIKDFENAISNIVDNACTHGFKDSEPCDCRIQVDAYEGEDDEICLRIRNTGSPFPEGMNTQRFVVKSEKGAGSSGSGFGGFRINQIMRHAGGQLKLYAGDGEFAAGVLLLFRRD